jgi:hypothetical protein
MPVDLDVRRLAEMNDVVYAVDEGGLHDLGAATGRWPRLFSCACDSYGLPSPAWVNQLLAWHDREERNTRGEHECAG